VEYRFARPNSATTLGVKVNRNRIGEGPVIGGRAHGAYLTDASAVRVVDVGGPGSFDQWGTGHGGGDEEMPGGAPAPLPDLVDAWGRPILYLRRARTIGRLVWDAHPYNAPPQFYVDSQWPYTRSSTQTWNDPCSGGSGGSLLNSNYFSGTGGLDPSITRRVMASIVRSPVSADDPTDPLVPGAARSAYVLISAGEDGIYLSTTDGPGSPDRQIATMGCAGIEALPIDEFLELGPQALDSFDDVRVYGGSM
jgi:hypothetical protein